MKHDDDNISPVGALFSAMEDAAAHADQDEPTDPDAPRDASWLRWLKCISIIAVPALILGFGFLFEDHNYDTIGSMMFRFWLGAGIGGGLGMIYIVRCMVRKVDP
jgi:hypothetical protein